VISVLSRSLTHVKFHPGAVQMAGDDLLQALLVANDRSLPLILDEASGLQESGSRSGNWGCHHHKSEMLSSNPSKLK